MPIEIVVEPFRVLGETRPLSPELLADPRVRAFSEFLQERAQMEPVEAETFVKALLSSKLMEIAGGWADEVSGHVREIVRLRSELSGRYERVLDVFGKEPAPTELPPELTPESLKGLFNDLAEHVEAIRDFEAWESDNPPEIVDTTPLEELVGGADDLAKLEQGADPTAEDPYRPPDEPPSPELWDKPPKGDEYMPQGLHALSESERAELSYYRDVLQGRDPQGVRDVLNDAIDHFFGPGGRMELPGGWRVELIKSPEYGARIPQQATLGGVDPLFAANGYELRFTAPDGTQFQPDAVQFLGGDRYLFFEFKDPMRNSSPDAYRNNPELVDDLRDTMLERAYMSEALPGCEGWQYRTSLPAMDALFSEIISDALLTNETLRGRLLPPDHPVAPR
jgi:hypothetical protein